MPPLAWVSWVALVMAVALTATNPFYLGVVFLCVLLVAVLAPRTGSAVAGVRALMLFGAGLFAVSMLIAMVNGNYGDHILFTIPGPDAPSWLGGLRIGGPVSAEGLVAAAIRGLAIFCVLLAFGVFNGAVSPHRVLRSAPAALFHAGLVVTVGLTLLPATIEDVRRIREMRALRGAPTGLRSLPSLVVPAVIGGLERSMRLAEAMETRGYGAGPASPRLPRLVGSAAAPLFLAAASCWYYYPSFRAIGGALGLAGLAALAFWGWSAARSRHTTRLREEPIALADRLLAYGSFALALAAVIGNSAGWIDTRYNPFDGLHWPAFTLEGGLLALACAWPALRLAFAPLPKSAEEPAATLTERSHGAVRP